MAIKDQYRTARDNQKKCCTIVEGATLGLILKNRNRSMKYLAVMKDCESVICCRVTPKQKAEVVRLVKRNLGKVALAIGDGANDVNMIQEGDIGVGIFGLEGMQAANSADFAIPEFKALDKLLLVHGRWSYIRNTEMVLYFFYKNMLFTIPQFFFIFLNAYSGRSLFDDWYMTFYNMIFTAFPLAVKGLFDQDVNYVVSRQDSQGQREFHSDDQIRAFIPYIYSVGQTDFIFNNLNFLLWISKGIVHGLFVWVTCIYGVVQGGVANSHGHGCDFWFVSVTMFTSVFVVATLQKMYMIRFWTIFNVLGFIFLSILVYLAWVFIADNIPSLEISYSQQTIWKSPLFYLLVLLNAGWFTAYDFAERFLRESYEKNTTTKARILVKSAAYQNMKPADFEQYFNEEELNLNQIKHKQV